MICFAKTNWICDIIKEKHNLTVNMLNLVLIEVYLNLKKIYLIKKLLFLQ